MEVVLFLKKYITKLSSLLFTYVSYSRNRWPPKVEAALVHVTEQNSGLLFFFASLRNCKSEGRTTTGTSMWASLRNCKSEGLTMTGNKWRVVPLLGVCHGLPLLCQNGDASFQLLRRRTTQQQITPLSQWRLSFETQNDVSITFHSNVQQSSLRLHGPRQPLGRRYSSSPAACDCPH